MRHIVIKTSKSLPEVIHRAQSTNVPNTSGAINSALNSTLKYLRGRTPVYDQLRWPKYASFRHHWFPTPGSLKATTKRTRARSHGSGSLFTARIGASAPYASYIEKGFRHSRSHKWVHGRWFIRRSVRAVFDVDFPKKFEQALKRTFGGL